MPGGGHFEHVGVCPNCGSGDIRKRRGVHAFLRWRCRRCNRVFGNPKIGLIDAKVGAKGFVLSDSKPRRKRRPRRKFRRILTAIAILAIVGIAAWVVISESGMPTAPLAPDTETREDTSLAGEDGAATEGAVDAVRQTPVPTPTATPIPTPTPIPSPTPLPTPTWTPEQRELNTVQTPRNMLGTWWEWPYGQDGDRMSITITSHNDPAVMRRGGLYLIGCTGFAISGEGAYFGIQTDVNDPARGGQGRGAIFSRWYENNEPWPVRKADTRIPEDGWIEAGDYEGDFVSVRGQYLWNDGIYTMELRRGEIDDKGQWVEYWVSDSQGTETWIGSLRFPLTSTSKAQMHPGCFTALEAYGDWLKPSEVPEWTITVHAPVMGNNTARLYSTCYPDNVENLRNARTTYLPDDHVVRYEVGLDYMAHNLEPGTVCE